MTIQRQYNLPNCKLVVEGLSTNANPRSAVGGRPLLDKLVNAECHFVGQPKALTGGYEFLEGLVSAVNQYAQEFLSGVRVLHLPASVPHVVHLAGVDANTHRLTVAAQAIANTHGDAHGQPAQLDLNTLQLFDLVEAVDQLLADSQTLPDLKVQPVPVAKRHTRSEKPLVERAKPAALGISTLAAASIALFFLPVPEVRPPEPEPSAEQSLEGTASPGASSPVGTSPPPALENSPESPEAIDSPTTPSPTESPTSASPQSTLLESDAEQTDGSTTAGAALTSDQIDELLTSAEDITDTEEVDQLIVQLRRQLSEAWDREHTFEEPVVYRVGVAETGEILGFKQTDQSAVEYTDETPLLDLLKPPMTEDLQEQRLAQFRVVFTPDGVVEVSPWYGRF
jgi:hypothetical protein